ncbi:MAG: HEPN domain-containing protein [bacterium]
MASTSQNKNIPGTPEEWLARAKSNLALAKQQKPEDAFWEDLCYNAQQAAEKALKAVLQHSSITFRYIHDLDELITSLENSKVIVPETGLILQFR